MKAIIFNTFFVYKKVFLYVFRLITMYTFIGLEWKDKYNWMTLGWTLRIIEQRIANFLFL